MSWSFLTRNISRSRPMPGDKMYVIIANLVFGAVYFVVSLADVGWSQWYDTVVLPEKNDCGKLQATYTHTHTHLTALLPGLPRWAGTRKVKPIWILLKQETVCGSVINWAICKSAPRSRQITTPAPHHSGRGRRKEEREKGLEGLDLDPPQCLGRIDASGWISCLLCERLWRIRTWRVVSLEQCEQRSLLFSRSWCTTAWYLFSSLRKMNFASS